MSDNRWVTEPFEPAELVAGYLRDAGLTAATDFQHVRFDTPNPPDGWRMIAPANCIGIPAISIHYMNELTELAHQQGLEIAAGSTLTAQYQRIDGEWFPIPETLTIS